MVKLTLITNAGAVARGDIVPNTMTLRQVYEKYGVNYESCTNMVDSVPVRMGDMDKTLDQLGVKDTVRMSSIVKADNAAEIIITGSAAVVKSAYKLADWKKVLKYNPDFGLFDEDSGEPIFKAFVEEGPGAMDNLGIMFSEIPTAEGYACATIVLDPTEEDKETLVKESLGNALLNLINLEEGMTGALDEAAEADRKIASKIKTV